MECLKPDKMLPTDILFGSVFDIANSAKRIYERIWQMGYEGKYTQGGKR